MLQTVLDPKRAAIIIIALAALCTLVILSGCGNSGTDTMSAGPVSTPTTAPHTAASGPAISDKLTIDQLMLDSPIARTKDKNGLVFLRFKYTDNDGSVYECVLPETQSKGQFTAPEWLSTFSVYRIPKVLAHKQTKRRVDIGDFPFISPKPLQVEQPPEQAAPPAPNAPLPTLPTLPSAPAPGAPGQPPVPANPNPNPTGMAPP